MKKEEVCHHRNWYCELQDRQTIRSSRQPPLEPRPMENDNEAHSAPVKIEALDESQVAPPSPQLAVHLLVTDFGCGDLDLPPSPPPLPLVSESIVHEIHEELSLEMAPPVHQITNEPPLKKRRNMHQKPDKSIQACKIEVETVPLVSGTAEIDTHGKEQMEAQQMNLNYSEDEVSDRSPAENLGSVPRNLETHAPFGSDAIVSTGQRGTITQDTPSGVLSRKGKEKEASSSGSKHPPCDRNAYIKPPQRPEDRPVIRRVGYRSFVGDLLIATKNVNKIISQCVRFHYPEGTRLLTIDVCTKFDDYPEGTKKEVHDEFLKHFQFPQGEDMDLAWETFSSIANKALQNLLNKCRDEAKDKYGDNIMEWKNRGVPSTYDWITANNWPKLCNYWCTEDFARRSEQNQQNRASFREGSFATTGSVNMLREPRWSDELFTPTNFVPRGQFCTARAKKAQEDYDRDMSAKYGSDQVLWPSFDADIWYGNTDNNSHDDNYSLDALGKTRSLYHPGGSQTSSSQSQSYSSAPPPLRKEDINAISSQVLDVLQPHINQFMEELKRSVGHSSSHQGGSSSHHVSNPDAQDDNGDDI